MGAVQREPDQEQGAAIGTRIEPLQVSGTLEFKKLLKLRKARPQIPQPCFAIEPGNLPALVSQNFQISMVMRSKPEVIQAEMIALIQRSSKQILERPTNIGPVVIIDPVVRGSRRVVNTVHRDPFVFAPYQQAFSRFRLNKNR